MTDEIATIVLAGGNALQIAEAAQQIGVNDLRQSALKRQRPGSPAWPRSTALPGLRSIHAMRDDAMHEVAGQRPAPHLAGRSTPCVDARCMRLPASGRHLPVVGPRRALSLLHPQLLQLVRARKVMPTARRCGSCSSGFLPARWMALRSSCSMYEGAALPGCRSTTASAGAALPGVRACCGRRRSSRRCSLPRPVPARVPGCSPVRARCRGRRTASASNADGASSGVGRPCGPAVPAPMRPVPAGPGDARAAAPSARSR